MISSPYDVEAHYARKRSTSWIGYRVHLTETCDDESPHFITHVETVDAPEGDADAVPPIHEALSLDELRRLFQEHGMELVGPPPVGWSIEDGRIIPPPDFKPPGAKNRAIESTRSEGI